MTTLRTLPPARPLSWAVEVELLRVLVARVRRGDEILPMVLVAGVPGGALSYALLSPAERVKRSEEYSGTVKALVEEMERGR